MKKVLTIAGSDSSGGAGIQADLKTMTAHKVYGMSVITALTAQNTTGVYGIWEASADFVGQEMDCVFQDIFPDAVKIGMVSSADIIAMIADKLTVYQAPHIILDPVMVATSGSHLLNDDAVGMLKEKLMPLAEIITPNIPEAEVLSQIEIKNKKDMIKAAKGIRQFYNGFVLIKGGHLLDCADDLLFTPQNENIWYYGAKINAQNTHGTGCTLSSSIACRLAIGDDMIQAVRNAKSYITGALADGLNLGQGSGPLNHCYAIRMIEGELPQIDYSKESAK